ncbi:Transcription factor DIVARICATA, partial [Mucuna pruriens]
MLPEIIDLTDSPPSPPRVLTSVGRVELENASIPLMPSTNLNLSQTNQQQINSWPTSRNVDEPSQIVTGFQPSMQGGVVAILEPTPESYTHLVPHGTSLDEPWTQREHELFVMGLIRYGKGRWTKIAKDYVCNKTPQQVQSYAASFSRNLPLPPAYSAPYLMSRNWNLTVGPSASYSMPVIVNQSQQLFTLVPVSAPFILVPTYGEASNNTNTNTIMHGFQMQTIRTTASTSMNAIASANEEIDLELRLESSVAKGQHDLLFPGPLVI